MLKQTVNLESTPRRSSRSRRHSLFAAAILFSTLALGAGCDLFTSSGEEGAPLVALVQPFDEAVVAGAHVRVAAEATPVGATNFISFVNVLVDGRKVGEATAVENTYVFTLDTRNFSDGEHRLEAVAFDRNQARGLSAPVSLYFENTSPIAGPQFQIIAPSELEDISGVARVVARALPGQGAIHRVDLLVDGVATLTQAETAGANTYVFDWDAFSTAPGAHILEIKAYGDNGAFFISGAIQVNVQQPPDNPAERTPGSLVWRATGYNGEVRGSVAVGFNDDLYIASASDTLYALAPNGSVRWEFAAQGPIRSAPVVGNNEDVFVASEDGRLYGLDSDGHTLWPAYNSGAVLRGSPALGVEGVLFFGDSEGRLHAVSSYDGQPLGGMWPVSLSAGAIVSAPVIARDRTIFVATTGGRLFAVHPNGSILWESTGELGSITEGLALVESSVTDTDADGMPVVHTANTLYAVSQNAALYALSGKSGDVLWQYSLAGPLRSGPVVGTDGVVYVGTSTGLVALNPGADPVTPRLRFIFPAEDVGTPAIDANETVYFVSGRRVHAINPNNTPFWNFDIGAHADAPLTIRRDGVLFVAGQNGILTALETGSVGLARGTWAMSQRNARHSGRIGIDADD